MYDTHGDESSRGNGEDFEAIGQCSEFSSESKIQSSVRLLQTTYICFLKVLSCTTVFDTIHLKNMLTCMSLYLYNDSSLDNWVPAPWDRKIEDFRRARNEGATDTPYFLTRGFKPHAKT